MEEKWKKYLITTWIEFCMLIYKELEKVKNSWVEQLYKYTEFYYWELGHLNKKAIESKKGIESFREVQKNIRSREVPLNAILNITMRLLPRQIITKMLKNIVSKDIEFGNNLEFVDIYERIGAFKDYTQPDMVFESENSRIFIELKIDANLTIDQVYKYIFLHGLWRYRTNVSKKPYILFITKKDLVKQWKPNERKDLFINGKENFNGILEFIKANELPTKLGKAANLKYLHEDVKKIIEELEFGLIKWNDLGNLFKKEVEELNKRKLSCGDETLYKLISDLLIDLQNRGLWKENLRK